MEVNEKYIYTYIMEYKAPTRGQKGLVFKDRHIILYTNIPNMNTTEHKDVCKDIIMSVDDTKHRNGIKLTSIKMPQMMTLEAFDELVKSLENDNKADDMEYILMEIEPLEEETKARFWTRVYLQ